LSLAINDCSMLALSDSFLYIGTLLKLHDRYGISAEKMNSRIKPWLA
jgi:transketolase